MNKLIAAIALAGLGLGSVQASSVSNALYTGLIQLSDNSAEILIKQQVQAHVDTDVSAGLDHSKVLEVGDLLRGIYAIDTVEGLTGQGAGNSLLAGGGHNELSGVFEIELTNKSGGGGAFSFDFGVSSAFEATYGAGAMAVFFEDANYDYSRLDDGTATTTAADLVTLASNSPEWMTIGFRDSDDFWNANAVTDNIGTIGNFPAPGNGGAFNFGLSILDNQTGKTFKEVSCFDGSAGALVTVGTCASGSLLATGGASTPFDSFDNVDFVFYVVPEPTSLALMGLGLLGLGAAARKRKAS